jgi:hypothetical protein
MSNLLCQILKNLAAICRDIVNGGKYKRQVAATHAFASSTLPRNVTLRYIIHRRQLLKNLEKQEVKESNLKNEFLNLCLKQTHPPPP